MSFWRTLKVAWEGLTLNKVRSFLTTLGVIIGVASVIAMVAIGTGTQDRIAAQFEKMGSHNLVVRSGTITHGGVHAGAGTVTTLTVEDAEAIAELPMVATAAPSVRAAVQARYRGTNWGTSVEGVTPAYVEVRAWEVVEGEFFTERDVAEAAHVCVLGQTVVGELFGLAKPVGEVIIVKGLACRVVGVLAEKGAAAWGYDLDDTILMPITTVQRRILGITHIERIEVQTTSREAAFRAEKVLRPLLRQRHKLREDQPDDFREHNFAEWAESAEESARILTWLLGSIASVSLLVGGIGIMNIMLVSVTERTREIGIRMALGGRRREILWQFLLEAMVLSGAGGVLGIALGIGGAIALARLSEFSVSITLWSVAVAFSFSAMVGVFFGFQPARRASRLRPIEALRYE